MRIILTMHAQPSFICSLHAYVMRDAFILPFQHAAHTGVAFLDYGTKGRCELPSSNPGVGSLRLVGGATNNTGVLQVYLSERWGGICADGIQYNNEALEVACRQLGYRSWV